MQPPPQDFSYTPHNAAYPPGFPVHERANPQYVDSSDDNHNSHDSDADDVDDIDGDDVPDDLVPRHARVRNRVRACVADVLVADDPMKLVQETY